MASVSHLAFITTLFNSQMDFVFSVTSLGWFYGPHLCNVYIEIYLPVVESQRFLLVSRRYFVLKEEDLNQSYLDNHQADHQTDGQTERRKK